MKKLYFAAPLFTLAEREFNEVVASRLKATLREVEIILPQERSGQFMEHNDAMSLIFKDCIRMVQAADVILAILDGPDADSGTSVEVGYAYALKKKIIGVRTDFRISEDRGLNLMLSHSCNELIIATKDDLEEVVQRVTVQVKNWLI